jgi:hypothetical protein
MSGTTAPGRVAVKRIAYDQERIAAQRQHCIRGERIEPVGQPVNVRVVAVARSRIAGGDYDVEPSVPHLFAHAFVTSLIFSMRKA